MQAGIIENKRLTQPEAGIPPGGVISPLLANISLNDLAQLMASKGWQMIRYADDVVIVSEAQTNAERALADVRT